VIVDGDLLGCSSTARGDGSAMPASKRQVLFAIDVDHIEEKLIGVLFSKVPRIFCQALLVWNIALWASLCVLTFCLHSKPDKSVSHTE
jgi:hypothetical protein